MYVNAEAVAKYLGKSRNTIYIWAREGIIPRHKIGGENGPVLFDLEEIDEWIKEGNKNGKA